MPNKISRPIGTLLFNVISSKFSKSSLFCQKSAFLVKILSRNIAWTPYFFERFQKKYKFSESTEIEGDLDQLSFILVGFCIGFSRQNVESLLEVYFLFFWRKKFVLIVYWDFVEICQKLQFFSKKLFFLTKSEYFSKCRQTDDFSFGTKVLYPKLLHFSGVFSFA